MAKEITFPFQIKFYHKIYDSPKKYKVRGDRVDEVVLKDGNWLRLLKSEDQLECGVEINSSREETSGRFYDYTTTITIKNKDALPVEIRWYSEDSYSAPGFSSESYCGGKYLTRIFMDEKRKVKVEKLNGWHHRCGSPFKKIMDNFK